MFYRRLAVVYELFSLQPMHGIWYSERFTAE